MSNRSFLHTLILTISMGLLAGSCTTPDPEETVSETAYATDSKTPTAAPEIKKPKVEEVMPIGEAEGMPTRVFERLWQDPGPVQDSEDAPKVLLTYPAKGATFPNGETQTRYAGRVDPDFANVTINGNETKVWPGGVFTGLIDVPAHDAAPSNQRFIVEARVPTRMTRLERAMLQKPPQAPLAAWPPKIASISPTGEYWLRTSSELNVSMRASKGHKGFYRIGPTGQWVEMKGEGEAYGAKISASTFPSGVETAIEFKLDGIKDQQKISDQHVSSLLVRQLEAGIDLSGRVISNLGTYLKQDEGWLRFGNFWQGTPFPITEILGERIRVDFGSPNRNFSQGYVERESVEINPASGGSVMPEMGPPLIELMKEFPANAVDVTWDVAAPVASVFETETTATGQRLVVHLVGAKSVVPIALKSSDGKHPIKQISIEQGTETAPPKVVIETQGRELWGYNWSVPTQGKLRLTAKVRPLPESANTRVPLRGLHIMLDAGHGGEDSGAIGPSGLLEKDTNLVLSALLEIRLENLGARVTQIRRDDGFIGLDERVDIANAADPDLFISVHHNSVAMSTDPMADVGPKVYYHYEHSGKAALVLAKKLKELLRPEQEPRWHQQNFRVNRNISGCPSVLIEGGFLCNPLDEIELRQTEVLVKMADAMVDGVVELFLDTSSHVGTLATP